MIIPRLGDIRRKLHQVLERERISWRTFLEPKKIVSLLFRYGYFQFFLVGGSGVVINLAITWLFTEYVFGLEHYFSAYLIGIAVNLLWNFMLYSFALFKTKHNHIQRMMVYVVYAIAITWINTAIVATVTPIVGLQYYLLVIAATIFALSSVNFFVFKLSLFKEGVDLSEGESARAVNFITMYRAEILIFFLALALRIAMIAAAPSVELHTYGLGADGSDYVNEAKNILAGNGFSRSYEAPFLPDAIRTPLYPLFLAGVYFVFGSFIPAVGVQAVLSSFIPLICMRIVSFFARYRSMIITVGVITAIEPHIAFFTTFFASEGVFIVLLYAALLLILESYRANALSVYATAGLVLGLAALARPIVTYLPPILAIFFAITAYMRKTPVLILKHFALFVAVFAIVVSPWMVRNYVTFDSFGMGTVGWFNVYTRLAATVVAVDEGKDFYTSYQELLNELSVRGHIAHPPPVSEYEIQHPQWGPILREESLRIIGEHPRAFVIYMISAPISVLTQDNTLLVLQRFLPIEAQRPPFSPTLYVSQHGIVEGVKAIAPYLRGGYLIPYVGRALWSALFVLALIGSVIAWRRGNRFEAAFMGMFVAYIVLLSINAGAQIDGRYRIQFLIAEIALAVVALESMYDWMGKKFERRITT